MQPWHMWGGEDVLTVAPAGSVLRVASRQLVNIMYARPETWSFEIFAEVQNVGPGWAGETLNLDFVVNTGVGRTTFQYNSFLHVEWILPAESGPKFFTAVPALPRFTGDPLPRPIIDHLTAQTIQTQAFATINGGAGSVQVRVGTLFAPRSHIRPEWFSAAKNDHNRYRGGEQGGM